MVDCREIVYAFKPDDPDGVTGKPWQAERKPRDHDWEPTGHGPTEKDAQVDLLDKEWDLYNN